MGIGIVLWDVDGTLLDFSAAESAAIRALFRELDLGEATDGMIRRYAQINRSYWERLERNELTKPEILVGRFEEFFREIGVPVSLAPEFNRQYQVRLGDTVVYRDDSLQVVRTLRGRVRQYVVSNGTITAQTRKLERSGLGALMDGVFLSEAVGAEKPNKAFFDAVFAALGPVNPAEVMIVGDSLTSDIRGGNNAGIVTCWYNPEGEAAAPGFRIDHTIRDLHEVIALAGV
jgi:2-haloacid dehalogenase